MKALIIGATGATGLDLTNMLLADDAFEEVHVFVRRNIDEKHDKLKVHVIDFDNIASWADQLSGDVLFSALGTTRKDAGSKDAQWKVDYTYQYEVAKHARANGVKQLVLVSSVGADKESRFFYTRMKGELEDAIKNIGFQSTVIVRPPSLIRKGTSRIGEKISLPILQVLNAIGLMTSMAPMSTETVAHAMIAAAKEQNPGLQIMEAKDINDRHK